MKETIANKRALAAEEKNAVERIERKRTKHALRFQDFKSGNVNRNNSYIWERSKKKKNE